MSVFELQRVQWFIIKDLNSTVGKADDDFVGRFEEESINDNEKRIIDCYEEHEFSIPNKSFHHNNIHFSCLHG